MEFSPYQEAVFNWVRLSEGHATIEAVAGSGKTTTIVEALKYTWGTSILLAFNKIIAEELKRRVPDKATASTFHAAGFAIIRRHARVKVDANKVGWLAKDRLDKDEYERFGYMATRLVSLAKQVGIHAVVPDDTDLWVDAIDHHDLTPTFDENPYDCIPVARKLLAWSNADTKRIDFDDMIYWPLLNDWTGEKFDWVFVDEAQDTNVVRRVLAESLLEPDGRLVAVGDPHQAIYGFAGASSDSMVRIQDHLHAVSLPLHISYRSGRRIIEEAQTIVPHIRAADDAIEGVVNTTTFEDTPPRTQDVILCRNNAPLIQQAFAFIRQGVGVQVRGRDIGQNLVTLIEKQKAKGIDRLVEKLAHFREREVARYLSRGKEALAQQVEDKVDTIVVIINSLPETDRTVPALVKAINRLFTDDTGKGILTLSTIHKAKGLEWDRVYLIRPDLIPAKWARQEWQRVQESNLKYVAITRAKQEFYYVEG